MATRKSKEQLPEERLYTPESVRSICVIPSDDENRDRLEASLIYSATRADERLWPRALQWFTNYAFVAGNHYPGIRWSGSILSGGNLSTDITTSGPFLPNAGGQSLDPVKGGGLGAGGLPRIVDNQLVRPYEANVSRLNAARPVPKVTPASDAPEDEESAQIAELLLLDAYEQLKMPALQRQIGALICLESVAALEPHYGKSDIPVIVDEYKSKKLDLFHGEQNVPAALQKTDEMVPTGDGKPVFRDELKCDVWGSFQLAADPNATSLPGSEEWFMRTELVDIGWAEDMFNRTDEGYFPEVIGEFDRSGEFATGTPLYWWERVKDLLDTPGYWSGVRGVADTSMGGLGRNQTTMRTFDCKPNKYFPRGRTLIVVGGKLVFAGDAVGWTEKYPWRWNRYRLFRYWSIPGRWFGIPLITELVPLQQRINAIDELVRIHREFMVFGQWLKPKSAKIPDGVMGAQPGLEIPYRDTPGGNKPERIQNAALPAELWDERDRLVGEIERKSGTLSVLQGSGGSGVRANSMLGTFNQERMMSVASMVQGFEEGLEGVCQDILIEFSKGTEGENESLTKRLKVLAREHAQVAIQKFATANLRDNVVVKLDISSAMLRSEEARAERAMMLMQYRPQMSDSDFYVLSKVIGEFDIGSDVNSQVRSAKQMVARVKSGESEYAFVLAGVQDPIVFAAEYQEAILAPTFMDLDQEVKEEMMGMLQKYQVLIMQDRKRAMQAQVLQIASMARAEQGLPPVAEGQQGGGAQPALAAV